MTHVSGYTVRETFLQREPAPACRIHRLLRVRRRLQCLHPGFRNHHLHHTIHPDCQTRYIL